MLVIRKFGCGGNQRIRGMVWSLDQNRTPPTPYHGSLTIRNCLGIIASAWRLDTRGVAPYIYTRGPGYALGLGVTVAREEFTEDLHRAVRPLNLCNRS